MTTWLIVDHVAVRVWKAVGPQNGSDVPSYVSNVLRPTQRATDVGEQQEPHLIFGSRSDVIRRFCDGQIFDLQSESVRTSLFRSGLTAAPI